MTPDVMTLEVNTNVIAAAEAFLEQSYRVFPVLDGEQFIGMLTRSDVLKRLIELG